MSSITRYLRRSTIKTKTEGTANEIIGETQPILCDRWRHGAFCDHAPRLSIQYEYVNHSQKVFI